MTNSDYLVLNKDKIDEIVRETNGYNVKFNDDVVLFYDNKILLRILSVFPKEDRDEIAKKMRSNK